MGDILACCFWFGAIILVIIGVCCGIKGEIEYYIRYNDRDIYRLILSLIASASIILMCIYLLSPLFT